MQLLPQTIVSGIPAKKTHKFDSEAHFMLIIDANFDLEKFIFLVSSLSITVRLSVYFIDFAILTLEKITFRNEPFLAVIGIIRMFWFFGFATQLETQWRGLCQTNFQIFGKSQNFSLL